MTVVGERVETRERFRGIDGATAFVREARGVAFAVRSACRLNKRQMTRSRHSYLNWFGFCLLQVWCMRTRSSCGFLPLLGPCLGKGALTSTDAPAGLPVGDPDAPVATSLSLDSTPPPVSSVGSSAPFKTCRGNSLPHRAQLRFLVSLLFPSLWLLGEAAFLALNENGPRRCSGGCGRGMWADSN